MALKVDKFSSITEVEKLFYILKFPNLIEEHQLQNCHIKSEKGNFARRHA